MPRAYADVVGNFRRGEAGAYARGGDYRRAASALAVDDPEMSEAYRRRGQEEEQAAYRRDYGSDIAAGNYEAAATRAGKQGDVAAIGAARTAGQEASEQQRVALWRGAQQNIAELEAIEQNQGQGYEDYLGRAQAALQQNPQMDPEMRSFIQSLPPQWNPRVTGAARNFVTRLRDNLLTPEQAATMEMTARQRDIQQQQAEIAERRAAAAETTAQAAMLRAERGGAGANQDFSRANSLRDEYVQQTGSFRTLADTAARSEAYMARLAQDPRAASGQADVGLVYALAKIYDPTSVVREGEFATMARQGGYGEQMRSWVLQAQGRGFSSEIRNQIMTEIRNGLNAQRQQRDQTRTRYIDLAQRAGIDPAMVVDDYDAGGPTPGASTGGGNDAPARPRGVPADYVLLRDEAGNPIGWGPPSAGRR